MTSFAPTAAIAASANPSSCAKPSPAPGILERLRRHIARIDSAHVGQARLTALLPETLRDTGLAPEDLTGAPSHDPALPFFMQAGFGRHDR